MADFWSFYHTQLQISPGSFIEGMEHFEKLPGKIEIDNVVYPQLSTL